MSVASGDFTSWNYDLRGRVTSENKQIPGGGQFITSFTYNLADLPATMTYPVDNEVVTFNYNNNKLPISVSGTSVYAQSIAYDSALRMTQLVRGANKVNSVFTYNAWNVDGGRLQNLTSTQVSTGTQLQNSTYDYDSVGNINTITDSLLGPQTQTFQYDNLDRLTNSNVTGGTNGLYSESYTYNGTTGNLDSKGTVNYTAYDANHKHAVTNLSNGNSYGYDANGNMTSRNVGGQSFTLAYDAENRLVSVSGAATANFVYDADGKQVKAVVNGVTTYYVGSHYEVKNSVVTKYYFAGATRLAVRTGGTLSFLLGDHIGSSSVTTDANGAKTASALYKAFGETRYTLGTLGTDYKFTGQREEASLGIYFFQSRWFDPSLGRFTQPDTIVPTSTQGTQAWDRYAFVNNNPVRYNDPTGHWIDSKSEVGGTRGHTTPVCMDPKATNYRAEGSCTYPKPPQGNAGSGSKPSSGWSVFWHNYCGGGSNIIYNVADCVSNGAQDIDLAIDVIGVIFEVGGTLAGCAADGACVAGAIAGWVAYQPLNAADNALGWISFLGNSVADLTDADGQLGDSTATSLFTAGLGTTSPEAVTDLIIDAYGSGYNHGQFNGILEWIATGEFLND